MACYDLAEKYLFLELEMVQKKSGDKVCSISYALNNIGINYHHKGNFDEAIEYYKKAIALAPGACGDNHPINANIYNNMGSAYEVCGQFELALEFFIKANTKYMEYLKIPYHPELASTFHNIGTMYQRKRDFKQALTYKTKALENYIGYFGEKHLDVAGCLEGVASVYESMEMAEKALEFRKKALEMKLDLLEMDHPQIGESYYGLAETYFLMGRYQIAMEMNNRAISVYKKVYGGKHPNIVKCYSLLSEIYMSENNPDSSLFYGHYALVENSKIDCESNLSYPNIRKSNDIKNSFSLMLSKADVLKNIATKRPANMQLQFFHAAINHYMACDSILENTRRTFVTQQDKLLLGRNAFELANSSIPACIEMCRHCPMNKKQYYERLPYYFSEKSKSAALIQSMADQYNMKYSGIPDSLLKKEHDMKVDISFYERTIAETIDSVTLRNLSSRLFDLNRAYDLLKNDFETNFSSYFQLKYSNSVPDIESLQCILSDKEAIRSYFVGDATIYIFVISKKDFKTVTVVKPKNLNDSIRLFRESIHKSDDKSNNAYLRIGYWLYTLLFPSDSETGDNKLMIIPDGVLSLIPFEALLTTKIGKLDKFSECPYLIKRHTIDYAYSATLLYMNKKKKNTDRVLKDIICIAPVFSDGDPHSELVASRFYSDIDNSNTDSVAQRSFMKKGRYIVPIPGTKIEVTTIDSLFENRNRTAKIYLHKDASEQLVKSGELSNYRIVHFATHGFVNPVKPELSGLILSYDSLSAEDGILYSGEIFNLELNSDLVVLSACETGLGKMQKGEGIIGLTRALLYAGAKNIISSLWQVSDESTTQLMIDFYSGLIDDNGQPEYSKYLHDAKLKLISEEKFARPFFWSPMILIGN